MGKGFNNYMCKKFFHPASRDNLKRVWMAEQKADSYKKKQDELRVQYEKEQDLYTNKAMLSKESKDKLSVNFMYEPPPGAKKEREREDNEPEYKFEWQRKFNAPREDYCKGDSEIRDQPFGIQVRNVRCIKCHKWGHINTDKECPMYNQSSTSQMLNSSDPLLLIQQMKEDGLKIKNSVLEAQQHLQIPRENQKEILSSEDDETITPTEKQFLKSLSKKQKLKLLKKLERMEKKKKMTSKKDKKDKKKKKSSKRAVSSSSSSSESEDSDRHEEKKNRTKNKKSSKEKTEKGKKKHSSKHEVSSSSKNDTDDSSEDERKKKKSHKRKHGRTDDENDKYSKRKCR